MYYTIRENVWVNLSRVKTIDAIQNFKIEEKKSMFQMK